MSNEFFDRLSRSSGYSHIKEFNVSVEIPLREQDYEVLLNVIEKNLARSDHQFIGGTSIFTYQGKQIILVTKNERITSDFHTSAEIIRDMEEVRIFFESLPNKIQEDSLGHLEFDYFELYFASLRDGFAVAFQVIDNPTDKINLMNQQLEQIKQILDGIDFDSDEVRVQPSKSSSKDSKPSTKMRSPLPTMSTSNAPVPSMDDSGSNQSSSDQDGNNDLDQDISKKQSEKDKKQSVPSNVDKVTGKPKKLMTREDLRKSLGARLKDLD